MSLRVLPFPTNDVPPIANLDAYVAFMEKRGIDVAREYVMPEEGDPFWDTLIFKERQSGEKLFMRFLQASELAIASEWREAWAMEAQLLEAGLDADVESGA